MTTIKTTPVAQPSKPSQPPAANGPANGSRRRHRNIGPGYSLYAQGEPMLWLMGGALAVSLVMIIGMLLLVLVQGATTFWPTPIVKVDTVTGQSFLGEVTRSESFTPGETAFNGFTDEQRDAILAELEYGDGTARRRLIRTGNYDLVGTRFNWVSDFNVAEEVRPEWAVTFERLEWGRFYGTPLQFIIDGEVVAETPDAVWEFYEQYHADVRERRAQRRSLERHDIGRVNLMEESARQRLRVAELDHRRGSITEERLAEVRSEYETIRAETLEQHSEITSRIRDLNNENNRFAIVMETIDGQQKHLGLAEIVRGYPANQLSFGDKISIYLSRWWEFLVDDPREANSEGGVFPAIFGTVVMTLIMTIFVAPFGVLAALYLREYAKAGPIVSAVRIAVNNLAGVPSIVFGVFGLGFFCYIVGGFIDGGSSNPWPTSVWVPGMIILGFMAVLAIVATIYSLGGRRGEMSGFKKLISSSTVFLWLSATALLILLVFHIPSGLFSGFYEARLPSPTFGKGGILWASLTLALLTLPVVIVATEEALAAVPSSMRDGSYACGASKWQTIRRIVLPRAMPGIMTGMILAMARGAGEVAPLMLVGAVKLAPDLPIDVNNWNGSLGPIPTGPLHAERSFMHLGFHIYDIGFQSPDSEAAKPMVFTTTLLLITIIAVLNLSAIALRSRLKRKFAGSAF